MTLREWWTNLKTADAPSPVPIVLRRPRLTWWDRLRGRAMPEMRVSDLWIQQQRRMSRREPS